MLGNRQINQKVNALISLQILNNFTSNVGYGLQYILLTLLVLQNSSVILTTRYSRVVSGDLYFTATAVFLTEMLKLLICTSVMFYQTGSVAGVEIIEIFTVNYMDTLKMSVPAILYVFQNNLLYVAASNLDAAAFQVSRIT